MGKSSKDKRDAYYRLAKEQNWRARSAFKLIQLDEQFDLFSYANPEQCTRVVDLCAAPGSWSQVLSRVLIKGESFGRRKWVEKMARFNSAVERQPQTESALPAVTEGHNEPQSAEVEGMSNLNLTTNTSSSTTTTTTTTAISAENDTQEAPSDLQPRKNVKIVAIDLQPMSPLAGITQLKADITHPSTVPLLLRALDIDPDLPISQTSQVDLVISDGAPDVTGLHDLDIYVQASLLHAALALAMKVLRPGGTFVAKIFRGRNCDVIYAQLKLCFAAVTVAKPRSSRASSIEAFVVCQGFNGLRLDAAQLQAMGHVPGEVAEDETPLPTTASDGEEGHGESTGEDETSDAAYRLPTTRTVRADGVTVLEFANRYSTKPDRWIAPFLACGDLDAYDADATYKLPPDYVSLPPVQPPTAPPYKEAIERRRIEGGMYGKTKNRNKIEDI